MLQRVRVAVVDDHLAVRAGITDLLEGEPDLTVVGSFASAEQLLAELAEIAADVVILDHRLPGIDGTTACLEVLHRKPATAIILLTATLSDAWLHAALAAGALGYVLKDASGQDLVRAVRAVSRGESVLSPQAIELVIEWARSSRMSHRSAGSLEPHETMTLSLASMGLSSRQIARRLEVSETTIKRYLRAARSKLGAGARSQRAVAELIRRDIR